MKRLVPIGAVLAAIVVAASFLGEPECEVRAGSSYDGVAKQWKVAGEVRFVRGGTVIALWWSSPLATRTAPFELVIAEEHGTLTPEMYRQQAIDIARTTAGAWEFNYLAILLAWLIVLASFLVACWLWTRLRLGRHGERAANPWAAAARAGSQS